MAGVHSCFSVLCQALWCLINLLDIRDTSQGACIPWCCVRERLRTREGEREVKKRGIESRERWRKMQTEVSKRRYRGKCKETAYA